VVALEKSPDPGNSCSKAGGLVESCDRSDRQHINIRRQQEKRREDSTEETTK
jgi:hypothetical protein